MISNWIVSTLPEAFHGDNLVYPLIGTGWKQDSDGYWFLLIKHPGHPVWLVLGLLNPHLEVQHWDQLLAPPSPACSLPRPCPCPACPGPHSNCPHIHASSVQLVREDNIPPVHDYPLHKAHETEADASSRDFVEFLPSELVDMVSEHCCHCCLGDQEALLWVGQVLFRVSGQPLSSTPLWLWSWFGPARILPWEPGWGVLPSQLLSGGPWPPAPPADSSLQQSLESFPGYLCFWQVAHQVDLDTPHVHTI